MGSPAEYTILVLLAALGAGLWTVYDRLTQMQRDVEAIKRQLGVDQPSAGAANAQPLTGSAGPA